MPHLPDLSPVSAPGRLQSFKTMLTRGRASKDGELEETTLSRLEVWEVSNLGKSTLSEVRSRGCPRLGREQHSTSDVDPKRSGGATACPASGFTERMLVTGEPRGEFSIAPLPL